jgi:serine/threonine protein kinase
MALGPYRILREIGAGGMGVVYLSERQDTYQKRVAIKVVRAGMASDEVVRRFRNERQILADLDHPSIGRLLDGGTTTGGSPYLVMEYIDGEPITDYCDNRCLSIADRLRLFQTVCAAVHHAHQHLVIHRDLKPANILITRDGTPKLLDFGIAKLLGPDNGDTALTRIGTAPMTPGYASPEQARGELVSTASDTYSLGVLLYELLCGQRPYSLPPNARPSDIERAICNTIPSSPSTRASSSAPEVSTRRGTSPQRLKRALAGDLDTIVLMAMRKEPDRRYASVAQLADDVRRHLEGLPVAARRDTFSYRLTKSVARNRVVYRQAALLLVVIFFFIAATMRIRWVPLSIAALSVAAWIGELIWGLWRRRR